jgi:hypothetical protein
MKIVVTSIEYQSVVLDFNFDLQALILGKSSYKSIDMNFDFFVFLLGEHLNW